MKNLSALSSLRQNRIKPSVVWVTFGGEINRYDNQPFTLVPDGKVDDLRPFLGLDVIIDADDHTAEVEALFQQLKGYASTIALLITGYGEDLGQYWAKDYGGCAFNDYRWLAQFEDARRSVCKNKSETDERLRLESEAVQNCPWLMEA